MRHIGLRGRLTGAIAAILVLALGLTFFAVHRGTESELKGRIDDDLRAQVGDFDSQLRLAQPTSPPAVLEVARRFVGSQFFGPNPQVTAIEVPGAGIATNQPELLGLPSSVESSSSGGEASAGEHEGEGAGEERAEGARIREAPAGFTEIAVDEVGQVRVLTSEVPTYPGGPPATVRVGEPMASVERALSGLSRTFLIVGSIMLALALAAGALVAARTAAPLRRMSRTAERIDAGDLSHRLEVPGARDELRSLAEAFNGMLDRLQDAFARQRRFVADASHELRTPLTVIGGQLEVLARSRRAEPEDVRRVNELVSGEVDRMERMVEDLLTLARTDRGPTAELEETKLGELANEVFESMAVTTHRNLVVSEAAAGVAIVDPDLISQLIQILTRNAIEHTGEAGTIRLSVRRSGEGWEIAVEDDGPGIPSAERKRVFERFYRTDEARTRSEGGTGLGLAIAKAIVTAHGGSIGIQSSELGGARVLVELPGPG